VSAWPIVCWLGRARSSIKRYRCGESRFRAGGTKHDKYRKDGYPAIMVPRHRNVTPGVAKSIAKAAGWSK
jgi:hypothetical protein